VSQLWDLFNPDDQLEVLLQSENMVCRCGNSWDSKTSAEDNEWSAISIITPAHEAVYQCDECGEKVLLLISPPSEVYTWACLATQFLRHVRLAWAMDRREGWIGSKKEMADGWMRSFARYTYSIGDAFYDSDIYNPRDLDSWVAQETAKTILDDMYGDHVKGS
jgi:hypothetical protein